jgi:hypothetical protein
VIPLLHARELQLAAGVVVERPLLVTFELGDKVALFCSELVIIDELHLHGFIFVVMFGHFIPVYFR